jgi:hypothetical protein
LRQKDNLHDKDVDTVLVNMISRERFRYTFKKIVEYLFSCIWLKRGARLRNDEKYRPHYLFSKGEEKL